MIVSILSALELENHLQQNKVVLIDFWAPWCGPCKAMNPVLEQISAEFQGRLSVLKVNIDEAPELAGDHEITSIPSLMLFVEGKNVAAQVGSQSLSQLKAWVEGYL